MSNASDFDFELKQAFHAWEEPADDGFTARVQRRLARREHGRVREVIIASAAAVAAAAASAPVWLDRLGAALGGLTRLPVGGGVLPSSDVVEASSELSLAALQWASVVSPMAFVLAAIAAGAVAYASRS